MRKPIFILIAAILCVCFWFLLIRGCNKPGPDHSADKTANDSTVEKAIKDSLAWRVQKDSICKIIANLQMGKDSLAKVIHEYKVDIRDKGADIQGLIDELNTSEAVKDTLRALTACDSLKAQFKTAKALVVGYMVSNDSLASTNQHIITQKDTIIGRLSLLYTEANNGLFDISRRYNLLYGDYQKINVRQKKWGIGPGIGVVYLGGVKIVPSISVHYDLFRF